MDVEVWVWEVGICHAFSKTPDEVLAQGSQNVVIIAVFKIIIDIKKLKQGFIYLFIRT